MLPVEAVYKVMRALHNVHPNQPQVCTYYSLCLQIGNIKMQYCSQPSRDEAKAAFVPVMKRLLLPLHVQNTCAKMGA